MQSANKTRKIMSALSMAAISVIGAKTAHGATLNTYYGQDTSYANSSNGIYIGTGFSAAGNGTNSTGGLSVLSGATAQTVSQTATTTIALPIGDYLSLAIDALLSGNPNISSFGTSLQGVTVDGSVQPSFLGVSALSMGISSTDSSATFLTPISTDRATKPLSSFAGHNTYRSTSELNSVVQNSGAGAVTDHLGPNTTGGGAYNVMPTWDSLGSADGRADVQPNIATYDAGSGNGNVGLTRFNTGGNSTLLTGTTAAEIAALEQFTTSNNTTGYNNATDFFDSLVYQGVTAGTVTLSPYVKASGTSYWTLSSSSGPIYIPHTLTAADTVNNTPKLVIVVGTSSVPEPASLGLLAIGGLGLMSRRFGRRKL